MRSSILATRKLCAMRASRVTPGTSLCSTPRCHAWLVSLWSSGTPPTAKAPGASGSKASRAVVLFCWIASAGREVGRRQDAHRLLPVGGKSFLSAVIDVNWGQALELLRCDS